MRDHMLIGGTTDKARIEMEVKQRVSEIQHSISNSYESAKNKEVDEVKKSLQKKAKIDAAMAKKESDLTIDEKDQLILQSEQKLEKMKADHAEVTTELDSQRNEFIILQEKIEDLEQGHQSLSEIIKIKDIEIEELSKKPSGNFNLTVRTHNSYNLVVYTTSDHDCTL